MSSEMKGIFCLNRVFLGYCHNCGLASIVGEFEIVGWKHCLNLCACCLEKKSELVTQSEYVQDYGKK
jgi:hypothetical protein